MRRIAATGGLVLVSIVAVEAVCRGFLALQPDLHWRVNAAPAWRLAWVARRRQGIEVFRPGIDRFDPQLGWRSRADFRNTGPLRGSEVVTTNARGARGPADVPYERTGKRRILVIGDSFAFGWGVNDDETYAARLEAALPDTEVVNLGVGGYGTDQMLLMLGAEGTRYRPDRVVVGVVSEDTERNLVSFRDFAKPTFTLEDGDLEVRGVPVPPPEEWLARESWRLRLLDVAGIARVALDPSRRERAERITWALWREIDRVARAAGADTLFLFAPLEHEMRARDAGAGERLVERFAAETGVRLLNLGPELRERASRGERLEFDRGHWGPRIHAIIAAALANQAGTLVK